MSFNQRQSKHDFFESGSGHCLKDKDMTVRRVAEEVGVERGSVTAFLARPHG